MTLYSIRKAYNESAEEVHKKIRRVPGFSQVRTGCGERRGGYSRLVFDWNGVKNFLNGPKNRKAGEIFLCDSVRWLVRSRRSLERMDDNLRIAE